MLYSVSSSSIRIHPIHPLFFVGPTTGPTGAQLHVFVRLKGAISCDYDSLIHRDSIRKIVAIRGFYHNYAPLQSLGRWSVCYSGSRRKLILNRLILAIVNKDYGRNELKHSNPRVEVSAQSLSLVP
jgi:hypothetical protein